jgi:hypothetical protein
MKEIDGENNKKETRKKRFFRFPLKMGLKDPIFGHRFFR